jgi:hypothetical protein
MTMLTLKQCAAAIQQIKITGKGLDDTIQSVGLSVLQHVEAHREASLAIKLLKALPKGSRSNALIDWMTQCGMLSVNLNKLTAKEFPLVFNKEGKTDLERAAAKAWYKWKPEASPVLEFDFGAKLSALLKAVADAQAKGVTVKGVEMLAQVQASVAKPAEVAHG